MFNCSTKPICSRGFLPNVISVRYRKINVQKPRKPDHYRAVIEAVARPRYPWPKPLEVPLIGTSFKQLQNIEDNPYENILAREVKQIFDQSAMIAIFHKNPVKGEINFKCNKTFKMAGMNEVIYSRSTLKKGLAETNYAPVLELFQSHSSMVYSSTTQVPKLLKIIKKMPHLILLACIVDGKLLSKDQTIEYGKLVDIDNARARLIHVINQVNNNCLQSIGQTQLTLVQYLKQYTLSSAELDTKKKITEEST